MFFKICQKGLFSILNFIHILSGHCPLFATVPLFRNTFLTSLGVAKRGTSGVFDFPTYLETCYSTFYWATMYSAWLSCDKLASYNNIMRSSMNSLSIIKRDEFEFSIETLTPWKFLGLTYDTYNNIRIINAKSLGSSNPKPNKRIWWRVSHTIFLN